jgi:hypothetical protein
MDFDAQEFVQRVIKAFFNSVFVKLISFKVSSNAKFIIIKNIVLD